MSNLELLPSNNSRSTDFVWFNSESAVLVVEHVTFLSKNTRQKPDDSPTQKSSIGSSIATVEKWIFLLWVAMNIAEYPDLSFIFLLDLLHQVFYSAYLGMEFWFWIDPLSIEVYSCQRVPVVSNNHTVRIHTRNQNKGVKSSQIFGLLAIGGDEVIDSTEYLRAWCFSRVNPRGNKDNLILLGASLVTSYNNFVKRYTSQGSTKLCPLIENKLIWVIYLNVVTECICFQNLLWIHINCLCLFILIVGTFVLGYILFYWGDAFIHVDSWHQVFLFLVQVVKDLGVGNWLWKREINRVIIVFKFVLESQGVVIKYSTLLGFFLRCNVCLIIWCYFLIVILRSVYVNLW